MVANPTAGRGKAGKLIGKADATLRQLRVEHQVLVTESPADMEATCRRVAGEGAGIVAVIGGDGTVSCAANGLIGTDAALAVLPAGTGDDFAKTIGAGTFDAAVRLLAAPKPVRIDAIRVTTDDGSRHFVNIAGAGFDSEVNETANAMTVNLGGTGTYVAALMKTLSRFSPASYALTLDDEPLDLDAMLVVVGNGISYGGGMKVLPDASLVDGAPRRLHRRSAVEGRVPASVPEGVHRDARDPPQGPPEDRDLRHRARPTVRMQVYADGEHVGPLPATFEIVPGALTVVVGPQRERDPMTESADGVLLDPRVPAGRQHVGATGEDPRGRRMAGGGAVAARVRRHRRRRARR